MDLHGDEGTALYKVVVNDEEQYSIVRDDQESPAGWHDEGVRETKAACLSYIEGVWADMRPLSLRLHMQRLSGDHC